MRRILTVLMTMGLLAALAIPVIAQGGAATKAIMTICRS